ncbi:succinate dehydrogenase subunit 3-2, mitochondrial-like isoform X2 [Iris pallida]|uniref:Succinate dehydrogenase subunit 3-2, mitochondrial-like isoform X2 n=1 Tax=Iris pallida TaxID=29817 RepID=A0AAX6GRN8_IRIPA|nr:succinate dehydrogenase subunit 3-2, mitochondrial-like isoform X2 [Iris pallida]
MDGFRLSSPSLEHKSVTRSPYTPSFLAGTSPSIVVPSGSRALHGSRVLAGLQKAPSLTVHCHLIWLSRSHRCVLLFLFPIVYLGLL